MEKEKDRCQQMELTQLGQETMKDGTHKGKKIYEVYEELPGYIVWMLQHQKDNTKFQNVMIYALRMEEAAQKTEPQSSQELPKMSKLTSGEMPIESESENEGPVRSSKEDHMLDMMKQMMTAFSDLKVRMDQVQEATEQQQVALHQSIGAINQIQQNQELQGNKLNLLENWVNDF